MQIIFDSKVTKNFELGKQREWLVTNGLGSYASSTVLGLNTRSYHGLLVASLDPPMMRTLFLSKYEEEVEVGGRKYLLAVNQYPNTIYPQGFLHLEQFSFDRYPVFTYKLGNTVIEKSVFMPYGDNTTIVTYKVLEADSSIRLSIYPIINFRDYHFRTRERSDWNFPQSLNPKGVEVRMFSGSPTLYLQSDIAPYFTTGQWYKNFVYEEEAQRGFDDKEDQYNPGFFAAKLSHGMQLSILASLHPQETFSPEGLRYRDMVRMRGLLGRLPQSDQFFLSLASLADTFIVKRKSTNAKTILAGYHWFADWSRDAMISIPGLTIVTKREEEGKEVIRTFLSYLSDGLIPNTFPESGEVLNPGYNAIDAPLWLINACYHLYLASGSLEYIREIYPKLYEIISSYEHGTKHNTIVDSDGLVKGDDEGVALTWMDAKVDGVPITRRNGKPVEISALWYNALRCMEVFGKQLGYSTNQEHFGQLADKAKTSFNENFWNEKKSCLHDCLLDNRGDGVVRPNQVFAISLPFPVLREDKWRDVLRTIDSELLTPVGLRTLSPFDPNYKGQYVGGPRERDSSYHQGTAWPWLFGAYVSAYVKLYGPEPKVLAFVQQLYQPFKKRMTEAGVGTISELYDGDPPHLARGCMSQAWSVAEILRSYVRDAYQL
jgi:predicted glycogen debranching enzyme